MEAKEAYQEYLYAFSSAKTGGNITAPSHRGNRSEGQALARALASYDAEHSGVKSFAQFEQEFNKMKSK